MKAPQNSSPAKEIAYSAVTCALLIGGQLALSFVAGVEIVTVLLLCFSFVFGARCGVLTAVSFSLLRCFIWGIYPSVLLLYIIYYPLFALLFGLMGKIKDGFYERPPLWIALLINLLLAALIAGCGCSIAFNLIKISRKYKAMVTALLWTILALCSAMLLAFNALLILKKCGVLKSGKPVKLIVITTLAAVCTVCFTLLDDVISPLVLGMEGDSALTYFYASFTAMLPQTVCTVATVSTLFYPLCAVMNKMK